MFDPSFRSYPSPFPPANATNSSFSFLVNPSKSIFNICPFLDFLDTSSILAFFLASSNICSSTSLSVTFISSFFNSIPLYLPSSTFGSN